VSEASLGADMKLEDCLNPRTDSEASGGKLRESIKIDLDSVKSKSRRGAERRVRNLIKESRSDAYEYLGERRKAADLTTSL